jgi:hypothetical protein
MQTVALGARLHRRSLDRDLACGIAAWRSPAHAAREAQLTSARHRRRLAEWLRSDAPVAAAGVVRLDALLADGAGPIYSPGNTDALHHALITVARWLDVGE